MTVDGNGLRAAWLGLAVGALGLAALAAVVLVLARTPLLAGPGVAGHFSAALILHVELATLVWFLAFTIVFVGGALRASAARGEWLCFAAAALGVAAVCLSPVLAPGPALRSNYFPVSDSPWFLGGLALAATAALLALAVHGVRAIWRWRDGDVAPALVRWTLLPLLPALVSLAWSLTTRPLAEPAITHEVVSWGPGHLLSFFFAAAMMLAWVRLAAGLGIETRDWRGIAFPFALLTLPTLLVLPLHALYAVDTPEFRKAMTMLMEVFAWLGPLWLIWRWRRGLLGRAAAPAAAPLRVALRGSMLLLVTGILLGNAIEADNTMVPAHYHGTIGAVTLAFIGVATAALCQYAPPPTPTVPSPPAGGRGPGRRGRLPLARESAHLWLYGIGFTLMIVSLATTGLLNAPRKTPFAEASEQNPLFVAAMTVHGVGGLLAITGTLLFVGRVFAALRRGEVDLQWPALPLADTSKRRDVRGRALAIATAASLLGGAAIALATQHTAIKAGIDEWLAQETAIDALSRAADQRRRELTQRFAQGVAMLNAKEYDFAITAFHRVLAIDPKIVEAHVNMGFALVGAGEFPAARSFFASALELRRSQVNAYYGLAMAHEGLGDVEAALGAMRTYTHLAPWDDPYRVKAEAAVWEWQTALAARRNVADQAGPAMNGEPGKK